MLRLFRSALEKSADFLRLEKNVREGVTPISVFGVSDGQKTHLASALSEDRPILYITQGLLSAENAKNDFEFYTGKKAVVFPGLQHIVGAQYQSGDIQKKRIEALDSCLKGVDALIVPFEAIMFNIMPPTALSELKITLETGKNYDIEVLRKKLVLCGYKSVSQIDSPGEFFIHGGIVDIFPVGSEHSVRIDFFDIEIESIRTVEPVSQRSVERISKIEILPISECSATEEAIQNGAKLLAEEVVKFNRSSKSKDAVTLATDTFIPMAERLKSGIYPQNAEQLMPYVYPEYTSVLDYMPENTLVVFDEVKILFERSNTLEEEFSKNISDLMAEGKALGRHLNSFTGFRRFFTNALKRQVLCAQTISGNLPEVDAQAVFRFNGRAMQSFHGKPEFLIQEVKLYQNAGYTTVLCAGTQARMDRLEKEFSEQGIGVVPLKRLNVEGEKGQIAVVLGSVKKGFEYPEQKIAVIGENDIFSSVKQSKKPVKASGKNTIDTFVELKIGDAVVHETNGIAIYQGIVKIETDGVKRDYLFLKYRDEDKLYVPVEQMNRVQKYIAPDDTKPKLSKLGSQEWNKTKARVRRSIEDMTDKLLQLYRTRENTKGIAFDPDTPWQRDFEEDFQYEETPDQLRCIKEIKSDMESDKVMDRLLCGDVGYGKTEVAIRAVFKAVMSGRQAAILAPTTILAHQHYNTLLTRLVNFRAVRVECLSRFKTQKEQKKIIEDLKNGKVDILVGTHKILGKDVQFKNLGLLVVDEEQRFGVAHKEKIKELKSNIDVLTLSATPIPRTLNMALSGIRDMSLLETPPLERFPVQTYVLEYSDAVVRDAIIRELQRGGQVYYLFNRVDGIESFKDRLQALVPDARIVIGHGQMEEKHLEKVIMDFYSGEYDVLLCTTIIENGIDVPGANTIIVQDAQRFGLAQLYQLRGRVGRSNRMAYAYFTVPPMRAIGEDAVKRLSAIEEFTQMGSGFKIAMRDLEIRGAGNLLGGEQHGHMSRIGYDLYCKMIKETVDESLGKKEIEAPKASVEIKLDAYISDDYIPNEAVKFATYRRISDITDKEGMLDMRDELNDRFGKLPASVENLLDIAYIRNIAGETGVSAVREESGNIVLTYPKPDIMMITMATGNFKERCFITSGRSFAVILKTKGMDDRSRISLLCEFLEECKNVKLN
jgi:transcription-repair coupling factor (superfamily II helicase)